MALNDFTSSLRVALLYKGVSQNKFIVFEVNNFLEQGCIYFKREEHESYLNLAFSVLQVLNKSIEKSL